MDKSENKQASRAWRSIHGLVAQLKQAYEQAQAPIHELKHTRTADPFHILVATILSARTQDHTTAAACRRLFPRMETVSALAAIPIAQLEKLIYPVGFYRTKARHLKQLPAALKTLYADVIPQTVEALVKLPGVGRKTANLVVAEAFNKPAICVDVHVHRICNRLGLVETATPAQTEQALRKRLPLEYWTTFNAYVVSFGQTQCRPTHPHCNTCPLADTCPRIGVANYGNRDTLSRTWKRSAFTPPSPASAQPPIFTEHRTMHQSGDTHNSRHRPSR